MKFWTKEEYEQFAFEMMDDPLAYYCFEVLYWCGIREGEMLALTPADLDFTTRTMDINKNLSAYQGQGHHHRTQNSQEQT